jgi:hypothetical protein
MLDPQLWEALEAHGLTLQHMQWLLRLLEVQENGEWTWHIVRGQLAQFDLRVRYTPNRYNMARVEALLDEIRLLR